MAQTSNGKRKTTNKAKAITPTRMKRDKPPLQQSPTLALSRGSSVTGADEGRVAAGFSGGGESAPYDEDQQLKVKIEPEADEGEGETKQRQGNDTHRRIAEHAFLLYAEGGFQHGHDFDHWLEAEREILGS